LGGKGERELSKGGCGTDNEDDEGKDKWGVFDKGEGGEEIWKGDLIKVVCQWN